MAAVERAVVGAVVAGNLPRLKEIASTVDLRSFRPGSKGRGLLHLAVDGFCFSGRLDVCRYLVEEMGFDANSTSSEGETPIFVATDSRLLVGAVDGIAPLLTYFLDRGGDPATPDAKGCTPLHCAAQHETRVDVQKGGGVRRSACDVPAWLNITIGMGLLASFPPLISMPFQASTTPSPESRHDAMRAADRKR